MQILRQVIFDYTFLVVSLSCGILGVTSGIISSFAVLKKQSLMGDAISHGALSGIVLAFILTNSKKVEILLLGAFVFGVLATICILGIINNSKIKQDGALALVLSSFFGLGMVFLTYVQKVPNSNQAGLNRFIFGQASTLLIGDIKKLMVISLVVIFIVLLFWKELKLITFDRDFGKVLGFSPILIEFLFSLLLVVSIIIGLEAVGAILMSTMIITPAVSARQWTNKLSNMVVLSSLFGGISGFLGTLISFFVPRLPTGPTIVVVLSIIAIISILFAPNRGVVYKKLKKGVKKGAF